MIEIEGHTYQEELMKSLHFSVHYPDDYTETDEFLIGPLAIYRKSKTHHPKYKYLTIEPKLQIRTSLDSPLYRRLNESMEYIEKNMRMPWFNKKGYVFDVKDDESGILFCNCQVKNVVWKNSKDGLVDIICDWFDGVGEDLQYCGRYQIPMDLDGGYLEYVKEHRSECTV